MDLDNQNYVFYSFSFDTLQCVWHWPTNKSPTTADLLRNCPSVWAAVHKFILPAQKVEYSLKWIIIQSVLYFDTAQAMYFCSIEIKGFWHSVTFPASVAAIYSATILYLKHISQGRILILR